VAAPGRRRGGGVAAEGNWPHHRSHAVRITDSQKAKRLTWCRRWRTMTIDDWEKAIFVDEKSFGAAWAGNRHNDIVWGNADTVIPPRYVSRYQTSVKTGAVLSFKGKGAPYFLDGRWCEDRWIRMLREYVFPYKNRHYHGETVIFIQDNDPVHLGSRAKKLMRQAGLLFEGIHKFPPNSGDLNPVENLWGIVLDDMEDTEGELTSTVSIKDAVSKAWRRVRMTSIKKMLQSMPERIAACIAAGGGRTRW
jgi:hypothetical protein